MMGARSLVSATSFGADAGDVFSLIANLKTEHHDRLKWYREAWRFYRAQHWEWTRGDDQPFVTLNYARKFVDKHVHALVGKGWEIQIPDDPITPESEREQRKFVKDYLDEVWRRNNKGVTSIEAAQMGSVTGDVFIRVSRATDHPEHPGEAYPRIDVIPSRFVFPEFGGPFGYDRKRISSVLIVFPRYKSMAERDDDDQRAGAGRRRKGPYGETQKTLEFYAERWFPDRVEYYDPADLTDGTRARVYDGRPTRTGPNPLGEIPVVHIQNFPLAGEYFGTSDLADVLLANREMNEKATDVSDVINYHGSPTTVLFGARISTLEKGANRMWSIPEKDARIENLELRGDLSASMRYVEMIKQAMHELGSVPEIALGKMASSATGVALAMQMAPLTDRRDVKAQHYARGFADVNRLCLKIGAIAGPADFRRQFAELETQKYRTEIKWPEVLPRDEAIELDKASTRLELKLTSRRFEQAKMGMSPSDIERIKGEIKEEAEGDADVEFQTGQKFAPDFGDQQENRSGNPDPDRPNPDVQGESRSRTEQMRGE